MILQFINKEQEEAEEDLDFKAVDNGFVSYYPEINVIQSCKSLRIDLIFKIMKLTSITQTDSNTFISGWFGSFIFFFLLEMIKLQVAVTPFSLCPQIEADIQTAASYWIAGALQVEQ